MSTTMTTNDAKAKNSRTKWSRMWSDLKVRTKILDLLDRRECALSRYEIIRSLNILSSRAEKALTKLQETKEVFTFERPYRCDSSTRTTTMYYTEECASEILFAEEAKNILRMKCEEAMMSKDDAMRA